MIQVLDLLMPLVVAVIDLLKWATSAEDFLGRALCKDLTNPRSSFQFHIKHLFLLAEEKTPLTAHGPPLLRLTEFNCRLPPLRYALQDMDKFSLKDSGRGDSEAGDSDCDMGRESPVDRVLLGEGFSDLIHLEMHHRLHPGEFQGSFCSFAAHLFKLIAFNRGHMTDNLEQDLTLNCTSNNNHTVA